MSAAQLCLGVSTFRPENAATAAAEVKRRGINCQDHAQATLELQRQQAQQDAAILQQAAQPLPPIPEIRPIQYPPAVYCKTYPSMGGVQTICR